jgi:hypothetical protein
MRAPIRRVTGIIVVMSALALAACGSDDAPSSDDALDGSGSDSSQADDSSADEQSATEAGDEGDTGSGDEVGDGGGDDGASGGTYNSGSAVVVFDDASYEFAPTGDPYSCFVAEESGIVMATFDGVSDAGDILYLDYDSDFGDEVSVNLSTTDPVESWYFGTSIGGTEATPTDFTVGDGEVRVAGEMISNVPGVEPRAATVTVTCD